MNTYSYEVYLRGVQVFRDEEKFKIWLLTPTTALGGQTPISISATVEGLQWIEDELLRIQFGVY